MLDAQQRRMIPLSDLANPLTWRYNLATTWGISSQELTLDVPELSGKPAESFALGNRIWAGFIATAITRRCTLSFTELVIWKQSPLAILGGSGTPFGASSLPATTRENSGVLMLHTGHSDSFARRRFFLPNMPANWVSQQQLDDSGIKNLYALAAMLFMGLAAAVGGSPMRWLIAYPDMIAPDPSNLRGVAFRDVQYIRVLSYCDKAPDTVPLDWP